MKHLIHLLSVAVSTAVVHGAFDDSLRIRIEFDRFGTNFLYTVFNEESEGSDRYINIVTLDVNAPFEVISSPQGWEFKTDNYSYVTWFSGDTVEPFTNDIAPGSSLEGFVLGSAVATREELPYAVMSWKHGTTQSGPSVEGEVTAPSITSLAATLANLSHSATEFRFTVLGVPSFVYAVEVSSDLIEWTAVKTDAVPFAYIGLIAAGDKTQFFRVVYADSFGSDMDEPDMEQE
jgi:hypothetical protein